MLFWDMADKLKFPKRGFILTSKNEKAGRIHFSVSCLRQKTSMKNGFIAVGSSGFVLRVEVPPVIADGTNKNVLSTPGSKIVWTPEAISFMSNITSGPGDVIAIKTRAEKYFQENNSSGQQTISQIDVDTVLNSKPEIEVLYSSPVISECDPHFQPCYKVQFHPTHEYSHCLMQRLLPHFGF